MVTHTQVGSDVSLKSLTRSADTNNPHLWYAQDSNGAIWKIDIVVSHTVSIPHHDHDHDHVHHHVHHHDHHSW